MVSWRPDPRRGGLFLGLPLSHGLMRGTVLEILSMRSVVPNQNLCIRLALSVKGEERSALLAIMKRGHF